VWGHTLPCRVSLGEGALPIMGPPSLQESSRLRTFLDYWGIDDWVDHETCLPIRIHRTGFHIVSNSQNELDSLCLEIAHARIWRTCNADVVRSLTPERAGF
jgi:hypothetical protein